jgi:receptor expression-enhancing protein 5/6
MSFVDNQLVDGALQGLDSCLCANLPFIKWTSDKYGARPWIVAAAGSFWVFSFVLWGFTGDLVCSIVGQLYPLWISFQALENDRAEVIRECLIYWVTYAALVLTESMLRPLIWFVPFYHTMRFVFVVWLFLPVTRGAQTVHTWLIAPTLRQAAPRVEATARSVSARMGFLDDVDDFGVEEHIANQLKAAAAEQLRRPSVSVRPGVVTSAEVSNGPTPARRERASSPAPRVSAGSVA